MFEDNEFYRIRNECVICDTNLDEDYFQNDYENYSGHYQVDYERGDYHKIPFNIRICKTCNTPQLKYLGNLSEIYKTNHADNTGEIMKELHILNADFLFKYRDSIKNIIEIGSSKGTLADLVKKRIDTDYYIIEPSYFGDRSGKIIIDDFYENVKDEEINANTLVISHVFEHFYNPKQILKKIYDNSNIDNFFLVFPDLEYYINNDILHVLNVEHTFYVDNNFLVKFFSQYGFDLIEKQSHKNHSILFYFRRVLPKNEILNPIINFKNENFNLDEFYGNIFSKVERFNSIIESHINIFLWPASIHSIYLCSFGLKYEKISGFLDNSPNKIGKKVYGIDLPIQSFVECLKDESSTILLNGGVFNQEIQNLINKRCFT